MQLFRVYKNIRFGDIIERENIIAPKYLNLSLTLKCNWKCVFCYKSCPKQIEFEPNELLAMVRSLPAHGFSFGLTGGEPTIYPYWRNLLKLFYGIPRLSIITNASGIRLKSLEDIHLLLLSVNSFRISIHGVGKGAIEVTKSRAQKGLAFLERILDTLNRMIETIERNTNRINYKFAVNVAVLKENASEIPLLIEKIAKLYDEYGMIEKISIFRPVIVGEMKRNLKSVLELEKFIELREEIKNQYSNLPIMFNARAEEPSISFYCFEVEPDGYVYTDMHRVRLGSWRKHKITELVQFAYTYGYKFAKQHENDEIIELPDFEPIYSKDIVYKFKSGEFKGFSTKDGFIISNSDDNSVYVLKGLINPIMGIFMQYPLKRAIEIIKPLKFEAIKPILEFLEREGIIEKVEVDVLEDFKIVNSESVKLEEVC